MIITHSKFASFFFALVAITITSFTSNLEAASGSVVMSRGQESSESSALQISQTPQAPFQAPKASQALASSAREKPQDDPSFHHLSTLYSPIELTIQEQLTALRERDPSLAYFAYSSTEFQKNVTLTAFKAFVFNNPILTAQTEVNLEKTTFNGVIATVRGYLMDPRKRVARIEYDLIQEDGQWRIRRFDLTSSDALPPTPKKGSADK